MFIAITASLFWLVVLWGLVEDFRYLQIPFLVSPVVVVIGSTHTCQKVGWEAMTCGLIGSALVGVALFTTGRTFWRNRDDRVCFSLMRARIAYCVRKGSDRWVPFASRVLQN